MGMNSNAADGTFVEGTVEGTEKRVQLPEPDMENITVLTRELPNDPILPWHHYDSPWIEPDIEPDAAEQNGAEENGTAEDAEEPQDGIASAGIAEISEAEAEISTAETGDREADAAVTETMQAAIATTTEIASSEAVNSETVSPTDRQNEGAIPDAPSESRGTEALGDNLDLLQGESTGTPEHQLEGNPATISSPELSEVPESRGSQEAHSPPQPEQGDPTLPESSPSL
jgi:hypothetical protein